MVELVHGQHRQVVHTVDVSQHGLFVATPQPPRERFLVQLAIHLPDGSPLPATAFVSREVSGHGTRSGVGLQLFALAAEAKMRWDKFIQALGGTASPSIGTASIAPVKASRELDRPAFLIKLRDGARLVEFYEKNVLSGGLYLATPVIKEPGTELALIVIHPLTENELTLYGRVERVRRDRPKGMEIKLHPLQDDRQREAFRKFIATGALPRGDSMATPADSVDIVFEDPVPWDRPQFDWSDVSDELIVDLDLSEYEPTIDLQPEEVAREVSSEISVDIMDPVESPPPPPEEVSVDLESKDLDNPDAVDDPGATLDRVHDPEVTTADTGAPLADEAVSVDLVSEDLAPDEPFDELETWKGPPPPDPEAFSRETSLSLEVPALLSAEPEGASVTDLPVPVKISDPPVPAPPIAEKPSLAALADDPPTAELPADVLPKKKKRAGSTGHEPALELRVACTRCSAAPMTVAVGGIDGNLGLLARNRAYWCNRCENLVSVPRLKPAPERRLILARLGGPRSVRLEENVPLAFVFEVAGLAGSSPRCPVCSSPVRVNTIVRAVEESIGKLATDPLIELPRAHCHECKKTELVLELIGKRETK